MKPTFQSGPPESGPPEPWGRTAPDAEHNLAGSGQLVQYSVVPTLYAAGADSVDEEETRMILELRYQEYEARHALEALSERGELELLLR